MLKNSEIFALPAGPSELCFDKNEFMKKTFSVDDFLHEHRNAASLEVMRDDLGIYLKILRSAMIELINEDYADFVNLSANLMGLDKHIVNIQSPLEQLKEDLEGIQFVLAESMNDIKNLLNKKKLLRTYKKNLKSLSKVHNSMKTLDELLNSQTKDLNPLMIERASLELIQLKFNAQFCGEYLSVEEKDNTKKLHLQLLDKLRVYFLDSLSIPENLERCLRIYATLDEYSAAEEVFKNDVVAPYMNKRISENALQNNPQALVGIYNQILDFISLNMKDLLLLTHHTEKIKGFNFMINSFWKDIETRLETHMASIFAPGNPDAFYNRYKHTQDFVSRIEAILERDEIIKSFRQGAHFKSFQSRWNLPVYFQIRFQEIAGYFEGTCSKEITEQILSDLEFKISTINAAYSCILKCWSDGIYINQLFSKFWKLTMQIISRMNQWVSEALKGINNQDNSSKLNKVQFLIAIYSDVNRFVKKIPDILILVYEKMPKELLGHKNILDNCLEDSNQMLNNQLTNIEKYLIQETVTKCSLCIRQVSDIPRLYRKTNREVPTKHCSYVEQMISPIKLFKDNLSAEIGSEKTKDILLRLFGIINTQYYNAVTEVLTSVQKTEESLRRLKNLREKTTMNTPSAIDRQTMSDDDKIRLQLQVDVKSWVNEIHACNIDHLKIDKLSELVVLVDDVVKNKN